MSNNVTRRGGQDKGSRGLSNIISAQTFIELPQNLTNYPKSWSMYRQRKHRLNITWVDVCIKILKSGNLRF